MQGGSSELNIAMSWGEGRGDYSSCYLMMYTVFFRGRKSASSLDDKWLWQMIARHNFGAYYTTEVVGRFLECSWGAKWSENWLALYDSSIATSCRPWQAFRGSPRRIFYWNLRDFPTNSLYWIFGWLWAGRIYDLVSDWGIHESRFQWWYRVWFGGSAFIRYRDAKVVSEGFRILRILHVYS